MGERIGYADGQWVVPDHPIIPFIEGDGTGPDIWRAARRVFDAALENCLLYTSPSPRDLSTSRMRSSA